MREREREEKGERGKEGMDRGVGRRGERREVKRSPWCAGDL